MQTQDAVVIGLVHDDLAVGHKSLLARQEGPEQRAELAIVDIDVFLAELLHCGGLSISNAAVFDGREDGGGDVLVVHELLAASE